MSSDFHHLPIVPASPSLTSHLQALELLAARLSSLSTRAEWETRVPLNGKASVMGSIVNTGTVKINIGGEWWVDMTPQEGEAWVRRRKASLLEEHAKVLEGWRPGIQEESKKQTPMDDDSKPSARFDTVFRSPVPRANERSAATSTGSPPGASTGESTTATTGTRRAEIVKPIPETPRDVNAVAGPSKHRGSATTPQTIQDVLATFMEKQEALAQATGMTSMPSGSAGDAMINEDGLPIHEIREDENGQLLSDLPEPADTEEASITEVPEQGTADFWSDAAAARRAALRRKVFDDPSDSDDESDDDERPPPLPPTPPEPSSSPRQSFSGPSINAIPPTPSSPHCPSPPPPVRRPSTSALPGKSILKPSAPRKKSVSFDSSVPELPDSPGPGPNATRIGGSMFPTPIINIESGIEEKKVPVLNAPKPSPKRATFGDPFAGFKPGFLSNGGGNKSSDRLSPPAPAVLTEEPTSTDLPAPEGSELKTKKPSLFAQRQRSNDEVNDPSASARPVGSTAPAFPALSTSKGTSSVKNAVMEKPPAPVARPTETAGVASTVTERPVSQTMPVAGPSRISINGHANDLYADEDVDNDDDDDEFYRDEDEEEEEEYDLDDAMLAREVALAYHQNRAYTELGRPRSSQNEDQDDNGMIEQDDGEGGGVMLALPEISVLGDGTQAGGSGAPRIVNPTPDNLRRFVRVGKLDNGRLVLAPGEAGWSDEEEADDDDKKENREEIKRALLGQGNINERQPKPHQSTITEDSGLPPTIGSARPADVKSTPGVGGVQEKTAPAVQVVNTPKKVSRFKADRMGNA